MPIPIDGDELQRLRRDEDAQLVEVLPADHFADEHLPGAVNLPLKELDRRSAASLDASRPVIVYCYDYQCRNLTVLLRPALWCRRRRAKIHRPPG